MNWKHEKPIEPGWYWWKPVPNYAEVVLIKQGFVYQVGVAEGKQLGLCAGQWLGPIQWPKDR
ncbi:MAG: hypothetical protein HQL94_01065 [Magnetococcales bacterium]|nr:hypothetical protein [Magnetococcales bacterium]MBF0438076.1 hypothetical protein [Magnetococcales bacterium]